MERVTIRLPSATKAAYDSADGTRSALMRRRLNEAIVDGEVVGVDADLATLAEAEAAVDEGRLTRRRATFKSRCRSFFADHWHKGGVTGDDAKALAETWHKEATLYGRLEIAFVTAVVEWFRENYQPREKPEFPSADVFVERAEPGDVELDDRLVAIAAEGIDDRGLSPATVRKKLQHFHDAETVEAAVHAATGRGGSS